MQKFVLGYFGLCSVLLIEGDFMRRLAVTLLVITTEPSAYRVVGAPDRLSAPLSPSLCSCNSLTAIAPFRSEIPGGKF